MTLSRRILYMVLGGIMALVIVGGAMVGGTAVFAQEDDTLPPTTEDIAPDSGQRGEGRRGGFGTEGSYLAEALGISVEELQAAVEAVRTAHLEEAVTQALADGLITQEQADAILAGERPTGDVDFRGIFKHGDREENDASLAAELGITVEELEAAQAAAREAAIAQAIADGIITQEDADLRAAGQALREYMEQDTVLADLLGISAEELAAAKEDGSVRDLIEASGLTQEEIQAAMQEAYEAAVAQAVADGVITQEQADQLQEMPGRGGHGGHRGGGHGHDGLRGGQGGPRSGGQGNGSTSVPAPGATNTTDA
jgi:hypothetical protein